MIQIENISKVFRTTEVETVALNHVNLEVKEGEFVAIMGPSGCGKSTLLNILGLLDNPTEGSYLLMGKEVAGLKEKERTRVRKGKLGFVFQSFNLVPTLDARANIELPLHLAGQKPDRRWLSMIIDVLGIGNRLKHRPQEMSGGQQQRVAVARALASKPAVIVADEPTGNLDSASSREVLQLLRATVDQLGQSVIMVTHDQNAALIADRVLVMRDGKIRADLTKPTEAQLSEAAR